MTATEKRALTIEIKAMTEHVAELERALFKKSYKWKDRVNEAELILLIRKKFGIDEIERILNRSPNEMFLGESIGKWKVMAATAELILLVRKRYGEVI